MSDATTPGNPPPRPGFGKRWTIVMLLFSAMVVNYVDRQTLGLLKPTIAGEMGWTNSDFANVVLCFQAAYALSYVVFGRIVDRFGARWGLGVAFATWSLAQVLTSGARGLGHFMIARAGLGIGEAGAFPGAVKAVATWFPQKERALANGLFNAGTNIGAIVTPILVPAVTLMFDWRAAFVVTGLMGLVWLPIWLLLYRNPRQHPTISEAELAWIEQDPVTPAERMPWSRLLRLRQTWTYAAGKFMTDPIFGMFLTWLPDFLHKRHGLDLKSYGPPLIAIYLFSDAGSIGGGWMSSHLLKRGWSVNAARKTTLLLCGVCALPVIFAAGASSLWVAVAVIALAAAAHQGFSATLYALPADLLPRGGVGSTIGLGGMLGAIGGMCMSKFTGWTLDHDTGYGPVFLIAGTAYLAALGVIHLLSPKLAPAEG